jgi:hypothetical protein
MTKPRQAAPHTSVIKPGYVGIAVFIVLEIVAALILIYILTPWWRPAFIEKAGSDPDATALISTFILIYTFFIAALGGIVPALVNDGVTSLWQFASLAFIFPVVGLDLYRVLNSAGDLYVTSMQSLPPKAIFDASFEFGIYFLVNVVVVLFGLFIVFLVHRLGDPARRSP